MGLCVVFPGQGTQLPGMGEPWRATAAWSVVERAEAAVDLPLSHLLLEADADLLARTREAQLAVLLVSLMAWEAVRDSIETPTAFAGHSLGQITALIASGVLTLEDGVRVAAQRAAASQAAADARPGRMAALIGATLQQAEAACADGDCWVANDNAPGQVVLGGTPDGLDRAVAAAPALGIRRVIPLNVGAAFHTPLMAQAAADLAPTLAATPFATPSAPVVTNTDAAPHDDADGWPTRLTRHLLTPVRWRESMLMLAALGADMFLEVGPGSVLSGLARRTVPGTASRNVSAPGDVPALSEVA
jgi:[acyl-carrier-protein] S-malonyltransferase